MEKRNIFWSMLSVLIVMLLVLASCGKDGTTTKGTITTGDGDWWDALGEPEYGGTMTFVASAYQPNFFDVTQFGGGEWQFWHESLFEPDWAVDRQIWPFSGAFTPDQYWSGALAESWKQTDPQTIVVHLRQGVKWQDKPPTNGREFVADDVIHHYDRILGTGHGYTEGNPMFMGMLSNWESVTATDDYTVVFKFKNPCAGAAFQSISDPACFNLIEAPESVVEQGGSLTDWTKAVGTGPFILTDFAANVSMTMSRNPNWWGTDPRHPQNNVPYADEAKLLIIPDRSTQISALRSGKIDFITGIFWQQVDSLKNTNPDMQFFKLPAGGAGSYGVATAVGVGFRMDVAPFSDIRVRKAMQMAIDRDTIAGTYYGGTASTVPCGLVTQNYTGYAFDYEDWPKDLKEEYSYNPDKARDLLADAGYPDGFETNVIAASDNDLELLQIIKAMFMDIGIDMEIKVMDTVSAHAFLEASKHDQMYVAQGGFTWPPTRVIDQFSSKGIGESHVCITDPEYDAIRDEFWSAGSAEEAAQAIVKADRHILEQHYSVLGPETFSYNILQPYLKGYSGEQVMWTQKWIYARLWVDQELKKSMGR